MNRLKKLQKEIAATKASMSALLDSADAAGEWTAENETSYEALKVKLGARTEGDIKATGLFANLERAEQMQALEREQIAGLDPDPEPEPPPPGGVIRVKPPGQFTSLGEQLQAIANVGLTGRDDNRLSWQAAVSGAGSGTPSDGGYLIQKDFVNDLGSRMFDGGELLKRVRNMPIGTNSDGVKINCIDETSRATGSRWGGVQVYWGAEADAATAKKPKFRQMELELKDLIGLAYVTNRMLSDAGVIQQVFSDAFSEEMTFMLEDGIYNGTGAGQPLGLLNATATVSVGKESGQPATTLVYQNVLKMWNRMWGRSRANAVWLINQDVEPQLHAMTLAVGTGGVPVYLPAGGLSTSPYSTLFGRPVIPLEYCATLGTTGDIMLVDPSQYLTITKGGLKADSSIHVRFINNENTFRFLYRFDGQPIWNSALTPFKGGSGNTRSPYVKLDTRS